MNIKKLYIAVVLSIAWMVLTFLYLYQYKALTVVEEQPLNTMLISKQKGEFLQGQKFIAQFTASENYLGVVEVRFFNYNRINTDSVAFRIKQVGESNWYYQNTFTTGQFQPDEYFPFGFPIIDDSKGKQYQLEIESVNARPEDAITFSAVRPLITTEYQYPKKEILKSFSGFKNYLLLKMAENGIVDLLIGIAIYANFVLLSLFLIYLLISYLYNKDLISFIFRNLATSIIIFGILVMAVSVIVLYLRKPELSMLITIVAYIILIIGVIQLLFVNKEIKIKK